MNREAALPAHRLEPGVSIAVAVPAPAAPVTPDSPAIAVMTDLTAVKAATTTASASLRDAEQTMILQGVRLLFVVGSAPALAGLITSTDLRGERQMRVVHQRGVHYDELTVGDVMTPLSMLDAIDFADLRTATVANAIATLQRFGRNHLLVVEAATAATPQRVRGVISRSQIERQLGSPITVTPIATSFSEIEQALAHG